MTDTKYVHIDWKDMYKDELAQELATEREKVLSEVAIKIKTYFGYLSNDGVTGKPMDIPLSLMEFDILSFLSEVKPAKLNQLKGTDAESK